MERCPHEWESTPEDGDNDGYGDHTCFRPAGHDGWCVCAAHFACSPTHWPSTTSSWP